ncbi:MAG: biotin/lipoyl-binding protein, partial [Phenylobacterium sp.]|nr:biotin/lipoyl-binding protein [Phenylobacterium sp.]
NIPFLAAVMDQKRFRSGKLSTNYIKDEFPEGFQGLPPTDFQRDLIEAVAVYMQLLQASRAGRGEPREDWVVVAGLHRRQVRALLTPDGVLVRNGGRDLKLERVSWRPGQPQFRARFAGRDVTVTVKPAAEGFVIRHRATTLNVLVLSPRSAELHEKLPPKRAADTSKMVLSPMPGLVVSIDVAQGQEVKTGEIVAVLEAMKMQNILRAERDGTIKAVNVKGGDSVAADEVLVEFA